MSGRQLVLIFLLLMLVGCNTSPNDAGSVDVSPAPTEQAGAAQPPVALTLSPESGSPGTVITATLRFQEDQNLTHFLGSICFSACGDGGASNSLTFTPADDDQRVFRATFTVPALLRQSGSAGLFEPTETGEYTVHAACVLDHTFGCANRPEVGASFRVPEGLGRLAWDSLPAGEVEPVPALGTMAATARSPIDSSERTAECLPGNFDPRSGLEAPKLLLTDDQGEPLPPLVFKPGGPLIDRHGYAGCGAIALDPAHADSFYLLSAPHAGGSEEGVFPRPQFTADNGLTWVPVPAPEGFDPNHSFVGFSATADGVTAWFSQARFEPNPFPESAIRGSFTSDGGQSWATVAPSCPAGLTICAWQLHDQPPSLRSGLIRSTDSGKTWSWASLGGDPFAAERFYLQQGGTVLEVVNASTSTYWGFAPLLRSDDGGATWHWVDLPPPSGGWVEEPGAGLTIQLEPSGSLLLGKQNGKTPQWSQLERGNNAWTNTP